MFSDALSFYNSLFPVDMKGSACIGQPWPSFRQQSDKFSASSSQFFSTQADMQSWSWPNKPIIFISDPHADAQAFRASLVASSGIYVSDKGKLKLTSQGKKSVFIIGGDCLDKGPSNLALLRAVNELMGTGAKVKLLAGNHDLRLIMGLLMLNGKRHVGTEHMFVRMGNKVIPLFKEVFEQYLAHKSWDKKIPSYQTCKATLFPRYSWFDDFPEFAKGTMSPEAIAREVAKMRSKVDKFEQQCLDNGLSIEMVYAAAMQCRRIFLKRGGEFSWFFKTMQLAYQKGSFLFLHAGLDDGLSQTICQRGVKKLNKQFKGDLKKDLFNFYFSSLSSAFRTKYRETDPTFSRIGANAIKSKGIHAIVHGHVSHSDGQQLSYQQGILHVEADITLDRNSRVKEGLKGIGFGATIVHPKKMIVGISADYPFAKVLSPQQSQSLYATGLAYAS